MVNGPPGMIAPANVATRMPAMPDSEPTQCAIFSRGSSSVTNAPIRQPASTFGSIQPNRPRSSVRMARKRAGPSRRYTVTADETASIAMTAADQSKARRIGRMDIRFRLQDQRRKAEAARASCVMRDQSGDAIASFGATHEPPTASTFEQARYAATFPASMPPVGQNFASGKGAATDLSHAVPPEASAGKNFSTLKPRAISAIASDTVAQPGSTGIDAWPSAAASSAGVPGLTRYFAPAATAGAMSEGRVTVPTPT